VASIPVKRLRQAGVLELLLNLANEAEGADADMNREKDLATMDLDDLVSAAFLDDDD
jgi:polyketide synthase 12